MREFMTRVSDYINEWREDPERKENQLSVVVIGAVAVVIIVLLLLLMWWGYSAQEKRKEEAAKKAAKLHAIQSLQDSQEERDTQKERDTGLVAVTHEEKLEEYMSMASGEELRQEYLTNTNALAEKIKELQSAMEQARREIASIVREYQGGDGKVTEKLSVLEKETETVVKNISELTTKMEKLSEIIQALDGDKIPMIQEQIGGLRNEIEQTRTDMAGIREKIKALEREDKELWKRLSEAEKNLDKALEESMKEIDKRVDRLDNDINTLERELQAALEKMNENLSERMNTMASEALAYRYEEETNTLYLMPNREK